jgi:hypothetical protein
VKRSRSIRLILLGGLSAGALSGCSPQPNPAPISQENYYTNNFHLPGVGYYHAPFRNWYPLPYNHFDPQTQRYFYGGQWGAAPYETITNISQPLPQAVALAQAQRTDVVIVRSGFGHTYYHSHSIWIHS